MTANPIPGLTLPAPDDPKRLGDNLRVIQRWAKTVSPRLFGIGTPIVGSNPPKPPSDAYLLQRGLVSVTITAGVGTLTLPKAFPNGWLSLTLCGGTNNFWTYTAAGANLQQVSVTELAGGSGTFSVDFNAVGW